MTPWEERKRESPVASGGKSQKCCAKKPKYDIEEYIPYSMVKVYAIL